MTLAEPEWLTETVAWWVSLTSSVWTDRPKGQRHSLLMKQQITLISDPWSCLRNRKVSLSLPRPTKCRNDQISQNPFLYKETSDEEFLLTGFSVKWVFEEQPNAPEKRTLGKRKEARSNEIKHMRYLIKNVLLLTHLILDMLTKTDVGN